MPQYAAKTDSNHDEIRRGLRQAGYHWTDTFRLGAGFPDGIAVSKSGIPVLMEIKRPGCRLTQDEEAFFYKYPGPLVKVESLENALIIMAMYDRMEIV